MTDDEKIRIADTLLTALRENGDLRISSGGRWLVSDDLSGFVVYARRHGQSRPAVLYSDTNFQWAMKVLTEDL